VSSDHWVPLSQDKKIVANYLTTNYLLPEGLTMKLAKTPGNSSFWWGLSETSMSKELLDFIYKSTRSESIKENVEYNLSFWETDFLDTEDH